MVCDGFIDKKSGNTGGLCFCLWSMTMPPCEGEGGTRLTAMDYRGS